tara:strand:+ start:16404 stop:17372 length:969 start_codon:yes stop_codon:yes gene_type:complete
MNTENLWHYDVIEIGQSGPQTKVDITNENIFEYAEICQNYDPRYTPSDTNPVLTAMPSMALSYAPLLRWEIAKQNGFTAYEDSQTMRKQTPFAKCQIYWFKPVISGDTITSTRKVHDKYERRGSKFVTFEVSSYNQNNTLVSTYYYTCIFEYSKGQRTPREDAKQPPFENPFPSISTDTVKLNLNDINEGSSLLPLSISESEEIILRHNDFRLAGGKRDSNIHVDEDFAKSNIFGTAVNSGPATLSYNTQMLERNFDLHDIYNGSNLLMRAITPVNAGDRITMTGSISTIETTSDKTSYSGRISGENQLGNLVCLSDFNVAS